MELEEAKERIILALGVGSLQEAEPLLKEVAQYVGFLKVGLRIITAVGAPQVVKFVRDFGCGVLFDGKFDDIPNTVGAASKEVSALGVNMFNVHASAGIEAMAAAVANKGNALALAVTVLTSLEENNAHLTFGAPSKVKVLQFARDAKIAGMDGIICSPQELQLLRKQPELTEMIMVTPGIRPTWAAKGDQKRVTTPAEAIKAGADYLVIGRPIRKPPEIIEVDTEKKHMKVPGSPLEAAKLIAEEIAGAA